MSLPNIGEIIAYGFIPFFIGMWCIVCLLLSYIGGWKLLADRYPPAAQPLGTKHGMASVKLGGINYNRCVTLYVSSEGICFSVWPIFRIGHKPFLVPWLELKNPELKISFWIKYVSLEIGSPRIVKLMLPEKLFNSIKDTRSIHGNEKF